MSALQAPAPRTSTPPPAQPTRALAGGTLREAVTTALKESPELPHPGGGGTRARWQALARWAARDLALVKVLEAHHDARAICTDLDGPRIAAGELWAVWAAEAPNARLLFRDGHVQGAKAWCSGADLVTHALVTVHLDDGARALAAVDMRSDGIAIDDGAWQAVGMAAVRSGTVAFDHVPAVLVGAPGAYLDRPGFWHGGAGIAACWQGGAVAIADLLRRHPRVAGDPHAAAHLGAVDVVLGSTAALLRELASHIDAHPLDPAIARVQRVRAAVEHACSEVIARVSRALGAAPLCMDGVHAQRCADLAVFIRQQHAERDLQALGEALHAAPTHGWWP